MVAFQYVAKYGVNPPKKPWNSISNWAQPADEPERGCAESQPQQLSQLQDCRNKAAHVAFPECCGWSSTQPRFN
jgi:hypothetical protein